MEQNELLSAFLSEAQEVMTALEERVDALASTHEVQERHERLGQLGILAHRLKGSAGLYGFPQFSRLAGLMERVLDSRPNLHGEQREQLQQLLRVTNAALRQCLNDILNGQGELALGLNFSRMGGTALLQSLLSSSPDAFRHRSPDHQQALLETELTPEPQQAHAGAPGTLPERLEDQLQQFVKDNPEVWEYFEPEVLEHLQHLRTQLELPESDLDVMFRSAHTIKGSSYMVGFQALGDFAHRAEDLLGAVRDGLVRLEPVVLETLHAALDVMERAVRIASGAQEEVAAPLESVKARLQALASGQTAPAAPVTTSPTDVHQGRSSGSENASIRVPARQLESLMDQMGELVSSRARLGLSLTRLDELQGAMQDSQLRFQRTVRDFEERHLNPDMVRAGPEQDANARMQGADLTQQFDELEFDSYNDLNILARSITELSADFSELRRRLTDSVKVLQEEHEQYGKLLRRMRLEVSRTSRVNFSQVTGRLKRWARERRDRLDFIVEGDETRVDSFILQRIGDPLLHLLTNALHHGIGTAQDRLAAGKSVRGKVWLRARQRGNFLEITVQDDGRGLDIGAISERALAKGLRSASELAHLSHDELCRLILLPGLSTAEQVNTVAGRGVGMDVVATTVRQLGGDLLIQSESGQGTTFTLRLPTTQRIMDILPVNVGSVTLAFAVSAIKALREFNESDLVIGEQGHQVVFEGQHLPLLDLREFWGAYTETETYRLVILSGLAGDVAVRVDDFGRIEEASVTPPSPLLSKTEFLSGTAISSGGEALPILDSQGLLRLARRPETWLQPETHGELAARSARLLLVDDSLSVRRLVGRMLERGGYEVVTANDGQEALELLQQDGDFGAVITDLEMPRMNGYELLSSLRARSATARLPLLIMTTRAGEKHQRLAFQLGASDYFTKPVNEALLLRRLGSILQAEVSL